IWPGLASELRALSNLASRVSTARFLLSVLRGFLSSASSSVKARLTLLRLPERVQMPGVGKTLGFNTGLLCQALYAAPPCREAGIATCHSRNPANQHGTTQRMN